MLRRFFLFFRKKTKDEIKIRKFILKRFGYRPKEISHFVEALTHKSLSNNSSEESNERLEFLGDAILDAVIAEFLFQRFPKEDEGYLTKIKSQLVSRKTLSVIAEEMELRKVIRYQKGRAINLNTLEGNAFEAIMGAIYLDGGYYAVKKSLQTHVLENYADLNRLLEEEIDFKSKLYIWSQKKQLKLEFEVLSETNLGSSWEYVILAKVNGANYGRGKGTSKKTAEQAASKETLELIGEV